MGSAACCLSSYRRLGSVNRSCSKDGGGIVSKILLVILAFAALAVSPVLLIMDQLYVSAALGVAGIAILVTVLVTAGEKK